MTLVPRGTAVPKLPKGSDTWIEPDIPVISRLNFQVARNNVSGWFVFVAAAEAPHKNFTQRWSAGVPIQRIQRSLTLSICSLMLLSGCASLSDYHYEHTQKTRAKSQYRECGNPGCSRYPSDYKKGWIDGFYEVSTGGSSCPPAIAPARYWKPGQILDDCDNRRHAYYSGWQDGATRAIQFPDTHHLKIFETAECPFPRCQCTFCGQTPCSCIGGCNECNQNGMALHPDIIEQDREIVLLPIPADPSSEAVLPGPMEQSIQAMPGPVSPPLDAAADNLPQPSAKSDLDPANLQQSQQPLPAELETPLPTELPADEAASPSDRLIPEPGVEDDGSDVRADESESLPLPAEASGDKPSTAKFIGPKQPSQRVTSVASVPVEYRYGSDNSLTIEFNPSDQFEPESQPAVNATIISDFDIVFGDDGLIEQE